MRLDDDASGAFLAGLADDLTVTGFVGVYLTATPLFDGDVPTPSSLSNLVTSVTARLTVPLSGGAGDLVIDNVDELGDTAEIVGLESDPIPEPTSLVGWALVILFSFFVYFRQTRAIGIGN